MKTSIKFPWQWFDTAGGAWDALCEACEAATQSIYFEQYIFQDDPVGRRFVEIFVRRAREGVKIRLLFDRIGSMGFSMSEQVKALQNAGVELRFYNPITVWHLFFPSRLFPRTHAKTMVVDQRILFTGSVCIDEHMRDWRDAHIRVEGPVAKEAALHFHHA